MGNKQFQTLKSRCDGRNFQPYDTGEYITELSTSFQVGGFTDQILNLKMTERGNWLYSYKDPNVKCDSVTVIRMYWQETVHS